MEPAQSLRDVARTATLEPLQAGDPRYVDIERGRNASSLRHMRVRLEDYLTGVIDGGHAKMTLTGHRGTGKTTELNRLTEFFRGTAFTVHIELDEKLREHFDYSLMLLWLADSLANKFRDAGMPLAERYIDHIADWFATVTETREEILQTGTEAHAGTEGRIGGGFHGIGLTLFAGLKSRITGNTSERQRIQRVLQNSSTDLVDRTNQLLIHAQKTLAEQTTGKTLLIIQDNLDRLPRDAAKSMFIDHGDLLRELKAHMIFTVPLGLTLAPHRIDQHFPDHFSLPMPKLWESDGTEHRAGFDLLRELIEKRVVIDRVFDTETTVRELVLRSGGSFRDLMRLLQQARLSALAEDKDGIDANDVTQAATSLRLDFERILVPARSYFHLLALIERDKCDPFQGTGGAEQAASDREFFRELIANGTVLEYNGDQVWFDIHPVLADSPRLREARDQIASGSAP